MTGSPATAEVTVVNADSWLPATAQLAALLSKGRPRPWSRGIRANAPDANS